MAAAHSKNGKTRKYAFRRAAVACAQCRKAKTRCNYLSNGNLCFRCANLGLECSLSNMKISSRSFAKSNVLLQPATTIASPTSGMRPIGGGTLQTHNGIPQSIQPAGINPGDPRFGDDTRQKIDEIHRGVMTLLGRYRGTAGGVGSGALLAPTALSGALPSALPGTPIYSQPYYDFNANRQGSMIYNGAFLAAGNIIGSRSFHSIGGAAMAGAQPALPSPPGIAGTSVGTSSTDSAVAAAASASPSLAGILNTEAPVAAASQVNPYTTMYGAGASVSGSNTSAPQAAAGAASGGSVNMNPRLDTLFFNVTPFRDIRSVSSFFGMNFSKELAYNLVLDESSEQDQYKHDIIKLGILTYDEALKLFELFNKYYGHWTSFPQTETPKDLLDSIRQDSSLLLAVCCIMGLIHYDKVTVKSENSQGSESNLGSRGELPWLILQQIEALLADTVGKIPQSKQMLQAMVVISAFAMSLSYKSVYFDGWYMSGYALLHFITREMDLNLLSDRFKSHPDRVNNFRLWNHLAVTHLTFCILSGRPCLIDTLRMDQCREILRISSSTAFDGKIVAELSILLSLYNCLQFEEPVETSIKELESAYDDWRYLCEQLPLGSFISICYHFARMMIYRRSFLRDFGKDKGFIYHSPLMFNGEFPQQGKDDSEDDDSDMDAATSGSGRTSGDVISPASVVSDSSAARRANERRRLYETKVRPIVDPMIDECIEVINLAYNSDKIELVKSSDTIKFEIFFSTVVMINMVRMGFSTAPAVPKERRKQISQAIDKCKDVCRWLDSHNHYYNDFVRSYYVLINKFSKNIHEQDV